MIRSNNRRVCFTSKGTVLVLVWSALLNCILPQFSILQEGLGLYERPILNIARHLFIAVFVISQLQKIIVYPVAGLLGEIKWTHFKVMIVGSCFVLLATSTLMTSILLGFFLALDIVQTANLAFTIVEVIGIFLFSLGTAIFQANAIQFGVDQLQFASSEDLSKFIHWYYWSTFAVSITLGVIYYCVAPPMFIVAGLVVFGLSLVSSSLAIVVAACCHRYFTTEPANRTNPLKLIFNVLNFARKHDRPLFRSAFTYGESPPSRLDLGKNRYGGPFTTNEVEDVKSFWRVLMVLIFLFGYCIREEPYTIFYQCNALTPTNVQALSLLILLGNTIALIGIPVYQLFIRPFICKYQLGMLKRFGCGLLILFISQLVFTCFYAYHYTQQNTHQNITALIDCKKNNSCDLAFNVYLLVIPQFLNGLASILIFLTALEFILAQAPRSVQGLLIGLWYAYQSLEAVVLGVHISTETDCHYFFSAVVTVLVLVSFVCFLIVACRYKYRLRDEPADVNERTIIEQYTERQLNYASIQEEDEQLVIESQE